MSQVCSLEKNCAPAGIVLQLSVDADALPAEARHHLHLVRQPRDDSPPEFKRLNEYTVRYFRMVQARQMTTVSSELIILLAAYAYSFQNRSISPCCVYDATSPEHHGLSIVLQLHRDTLIRQMDCGDLLKPENIF